MGRREPTRQRGIESNITGVWSPLWHHKLAASRYNLNVSPQFVERAASRSHKWLFRIMMCLLTAWRHILFGNNTGRVNFASHWSLKERGKKLEKLAEAAVGITMMKSSQGRSSGIFSRDNNRLRSVRHQAPTWTSASSTCLASWCPIQSQNDGRERGRVEEGR